jgi:tetratricopeptide (TPR) repeat protein
VRISRQDLEGASADATEAIRRSGGPPALEIAAWASYYRRRYEEARAFADEAVASAPDQTVRIGALAVGARIRHGSGDLQGAIAQLEQVGDGPPEVRGVADVWHAHALVHVGDAAGALRLADRALAAGDGLAQPFAPLHGRFARVMALGHLGRPRDALAACADLDDAVIRFGEQAGRFVAPAGNIRGWVLRNLGRHDEADEANEGALEASGLAGLPRTHAMAEAYWVALLDLADGALLLGNVDLAAERLARAAPLEAWDGTMAWHQRHRLGLLRARLALARGDRSTAGAEARAVAAAAAGVGARRYATLARAVVAAADPTVDPATVIDELDRVAGLESWWYAAAIAAHRSDDALRHHAERRVALLISSAGGEGDRLGPFAARLLAD